MTDKKVRREVLRPGNGDGAADALDELRLVFVARAVFRGLVVQGHQRSIEAGEMCWALPGGQWAYGVDLAARDASFTVILAPTAAQLVALRNSPAEG